MDFNPEKDLAVFNDFFAKRPEVLPENLKKDLVSFYIPYAARLINLKKQKKTSQGLVVGVSAIQGAGKTTQGEILEILLKHFGFYSVSLSIDDHYVTHKQLCRIRERDPRFIRRGVTHDIALAIKDLANLKNMDEDYPIVISGYDKGSQKGDGDRFRWINPEKGLSIKCQITSGQVTVDKQTRQEPVLKLLSANFNNEQIPVPDTMGSDIPIAEHFLPDRLVSFLKSYDGQEADIFLIEGESVRFMVGGFNIEVPKIDLPKGWHLVAKKPDFIFYDGWMLGARQVMDESVFNLDLPALETPEDKQFARDVNKKLFDYEILWEMIEFMSVLYVENYQMSLNWRDQAEEVLRKKGQGMTQAQIKEFVYYFWRSIHPAIQIKNLAHDMVHAQQVVIINDDHSIKKVTTPSELSGGGI